MPQLDLYILSSQVFWLLIKFYLFYLIMLNTYITSIVRVFKMRNKFAKRAIDKEARLRLLKEVSYHYHTLFFK